MIGNNLYHIDMCKRGVAARQRRGEGERKKGGAPQLGYIFVGGGTPVRSHFVVSRELRNFIFGHAVGRHCACVCVACSVHVVRTWSARVYLLYEKRTGTELYSRVSSSLTP